MCCRLAWTTEKRGLKNNHVPWGAREGGRLLGAALSDQCLVSLFTGTLLQNVPRPGLPAQSCWPAYRGLRTHPANTWPAPARALSFASVSETPPLPPVPCSLFPLRTLNPGTWFLLLRSEWAMLGCSCRTSTLRYLQRPGLIPQGDTHNICLHVIVLDVTPALGREASLDCILHDRK